MWAGATTEAIEATNAHSDGVAEIHNTLRQGAGVTLGGAVAVPT